VDVDEEFVCYRYVNLDTNQEVALIPKSGIIVNRDPPVTEAQLNTDADMLDSEAASVLDLEAANVLDLEAAVTLQQRSEEESEISNALKDIDMEYEQSSTKYKLSTNDQKETNTGLKTEGEIKTEHTTEITAEITTMYATNTPNTTEINTIKDTNATVEISTILGTNTETNANTIITTETNTIPETNATKTNTMIGTIETIETIATNTNEISTTEPQITETQTAETRNDDEVFLVKKPFYKTRHFKQLFIKGDNVVYVCEDLPISARENFRTHCKSKYSDLMYN
jgi:hypothetical protein